MAEQAFGYRLLSSDFFPYSIYSGWRQTGFLLGSCFQLVGFSQRSRHPLDIWLCVAFQVQQLSLGRQAQGLVSRGPDNGYKPSSGFP